MHALLRKLAVAAAITVLGVTTLGVTGPAAASPVAPAREGWCC